MRAAQLGLLVANKIEYSKLIPTPIMERTLVSINLICLLTYILACKWVDWRKWVLGNAESIMKRDGISEFLTLLLPPATVLVGRTSENHTVFDLKKKRIILWPPKAYPHGDKCYFILFPFLLKKWYSKLMYEERNRICMHKMNRCIFCTKFTASTHPVFVFLHPQLKQLMRGVGVIHGPDSWIVNFIW